MTHLAPNRKAVGQDIRAGHILGNLETLSGSPQYSNCLPPLGAPSKDGEWRGGLGAEGPGLSDLQPTVHRSCPWATSQEERSNARSSWGQVVVRQVEVRTEAGEGGKPGGSGRVLDGVGWPGCRKVLYAAATSLPITHPPTP